MTTPVRSLPEVAREWENDKSPAELRAHLESAIANDERVLLFSLRMSGEGSRFLTATCTPASRKGTRIHYLTVGGYLNDWIQRWLAAAR